jgi:hypothetical protein
MDPMEPGTFIAGRAAMSLSKSSGLFLHYTILNGQDRDVGCVFIRVLA